jgi:hypothetical protein
LRNRIFPYLSRGFPLGFFFPHDLKAADYIEKGAPDVLTLYGNDTDGAVRDILNEMSIKEVSIEEAVDGLRTGKPETGEAVDIGELDTSILKIDKRSMTADDLKRFREVAGMLKATPENAVKIDSEKTWKEFLKNNPSSNLNENAEEYINLIINMNPWTEGYSPKSNTLSVGTKISIAMSSEQADESPGGWATLDQINSIADIRNNLAVTSEFKSDINRINIYEVVKDLPVKEGPVGSQIDIIEDVYLSGGGTQEKLNVPAALRMKYIKKVDEILLK